MSEFMYLKMFFREFYSRRIRYPVKYVVDEIRWLLMTQEQRDEWMRKEAAESSKRLMEIILNGATLVAGLAALSAVQAVKKDIDEKNPNK